MMILGIETSCDETAIAILKIENRKLEIKSNIVSSQIKVHKKWGGVVPTLAKREHQRNLAPVLKKALGEARLLKSKIKNQKSKIQIKNKKLKEILKREEFLYQKLKKFFSNYQKPRIDAIAVTVGIGLEPALWVGVNFAKALSFFWDIPIVPIHHIEAHIFANFAGRKFNFQDKTIFPAICLAVSGGHTQLILMEDYGKYKLLGETRDDTTGECFDKVARMLGLGYPGGSAIAAEAAKFSISNSQFSIKLPRPMIYQKNYDFSFSGLKTAALYDFKKRPAQIKKSKEYIRKMSQEVQQAIIDVLIKKTIKAANDYKVRIILLSGGVAANYELRRQLRERIEKEIPDTKYYIPDTSLCTDNGAMVAMAGYFHYFKKKTKNWQEIKANANLKL